ncbi:unnamed protein product [Notodromas monacha]|uniref:UBA domain-containing protein n=1 Tax=Notodromas monacha TaxID=399045 RepID=A0A7R9BV87_9CRUS|nr:unnamed protein product [Notodromas monacha]CAG0922373.1 unnamed protein product [Notodromas monacha]
MIFSGATLEIQRQQMMDQLEQQMILSRQQELANRGFDNFNRGAPPPEQVVADETLVASLVDMGFSRERAVRALQRANNDIEMATNFMLQDADANSNRQ